MLLALGSFLLASTLLLASVVLAVNGESWGGSMIASAILFMVAAGTVGWAWQTAKQISDLASDTVSAGGNLTQPGEPAHARRADEQLRISEAKM